MRQTLPLTALITCLLLSLGVAKADQAILIGGGYNINGSQGQIELNVKWVQEVLKQANLPVTTFFTDGDDPAPDVHYQHRESEDTGANALNELAAQLEPVARLFGDQGLNQQRYRNHSVEDVRGSTKADLLTQSLKDLISSAPDDPSLIIYNGHGKQSKSTVDKVTLELWDDTQLTANELHSILGKSNAPTRFVFTQCYSGGFHRLAYANPESGLELSSNTRCGFTAESAYRLAEGCSASINTDDYRDYTTYFFAALDGYDRQGEILAEDADPDQDGTVSMREAHFYTLENAHSTDLSRSTSEDFLNRWEPWYLKWTSAKQGLPNNEYAKLYRTLADKHNISLSNNTAKIIRSKLENYQKTSEELQSRRHELRNDLRDVQHQLVQSATKQWPALAGPYTAQFQSMAASGVLINVATWLREQSAYETLVDLQNEDDNIDGALLDAERNATQMQKLFYFRKLANLKSQLYQHGDASHISSYEKLVSCESAPLIFDEKKVLTTSTDVDK